MQGKLAQWVTVCRLSLDPGRSTIQLRIETESASAERWAGMEASEPPARMRELARMVRIRIDG